MFCLLAVCASFRWRRMRPQMSRSASSYSRRTARKRASQASPRYRRRVANLGQIGGRLGSRSASNMLGMRVNVRSRGRHALAPKRDRKLSSEGLGDSHIPRQCCGLLAPAAITRALGSAPGWRPSLAASRMRQFRLTACSWAMNSRSTIRRRRPVLADRAAITSKLQHIRAGDRLVAVDRNSTGPAVCAAGVMTW